MGETRTILTRNLTAESKPIHSNPSSRIFESAVMLDNIRSAWNVGSILRSAEGFGFVHAYLCGITPTPENMAVRKTSLGAEDSIEWSHHTDGVVLTGELKTKGWKIIGLEEDERSAPLTELSKSHLSSRFVLIVGNEVIGIDPHLLDLCNLIYHIPMQGEKRSFNAAIAFGIAAYALR